VAEEKKVLTLGDRKVPVTELDIVQRSEGSLAEYVLEDGSVIRVSNTAAVVYRMDDLWDSDGNPIYIAKIGTSVTTVKSKLNKFAKGDGTN
jgi:hypothetical protein